MTIIPTHDKPFEWQNIEWETTRVYPYFVQIWDEYRGAVIEIHIGDNGQLEVDIEEQVV